MSWLLDLVVQSIPVLVTGILAGQKVRITLDGKKLPVKVPSRKGNGKSGKRTPPGGSEPSQSPSQPSLPL